MEIEALSALAGAVAEAGGIVTLLWLLRIEQQRHDTLIRVLIARTEKQDDDPDEKRI